MTQTKCILCPVDFSDFSRHALDSAVRFARLNRRRVVALHVWARWPAVDVVPSLADSAPATRAVEKEERDALLTHLRQLVRPYATEPVTIEPVVVVAPEVEHEILAQAEAMHADAIVMGTHGRSGVRRLLLGSVAERVLRMARCPVMVVPRTAMEADTAKTHSFSHVLCPVDFSCDSIAALCHATSLARRAAGTVTVLHVIDVPAALYEMPGFEIASYRHDAVTKSRTRLAELIPESSARALDVVVSDGRPDQQILRVAGERGVDLIVMGVSGRGTVDVAVFGSTTLRVLRGARCPVLTIRHEERAS